MALQLARTIDDERLVGLRVSATKQLVSILNMLHPAVRAKSGSRRLAVVRQLNAANAR
jgi:hypothetical protein